MYSGDDSYTLGIGYLSCRVLDVIFAEYIDRHKDRDSVEGFVVIQYSTE